MGLPVSPVPTGWPLRVIVPLMSAFLQQLPALIGVVIGAAGSYLAVMRNDRSRFRRERAAYWQDRRLSVYTDYAMSIKRSVSVTYRLAAHVGNDPHPHPLTPEQAYPLLDDAYDARDLAWESLLLLGAPEVVDAARDWAFTLRRMDFFVRSGTEDLGEWQALLEAQRVTRAGFYDAARRDLALQPGHSGRWRAGDDADGVRVSGQSDILEG